MKISNAPRHPTSFSKEKARSTLRLLPAISTLEDMMGQYIYVYPEKNMIIVRLGVKRGDIIWQDLFKQIARMN